MKNLILAGAVLLLLPAISKAQTIGIAAGSPKTVTINISAGPVVSGVTVSGCNIFRASVSGAENGTAAINGATLIPCSGTYVDTTVVAGNTYFYTADAQSSTGSLSKFSNEVSAVVPQNPSAPSLSAAIVSIKIAGHDETISAQLKDTPGSIASYELYASGKLIGYKVGIVVPETGVYNFTWGGNVVGSTPILTVTDALGQVTSTALTATNALDGFNTECHPIEGLSYCI